MKYSKAASAEELLIRNTAAIQKAATLFFRSAVFKSRERTELASVGLLVVFLFCSPLLLNEIASLLATKLHWSQYFVSAVQFRRVL